ncbi:MAG: hypothetical protein AAF242_09460 [Bacteroidota bacterium]
MYYKKVKSGDITIEFHSNWLGVETVIVKGKILSKKSSIMGTHHHFTPEENGETVNYILSSKVGGDMNAYLDLRRSGKLIHENVHIPMGLKPRAPKNTFKYDGIQLIREYDIEEGITALKKGLELGPEDPEIHFFMACGYSIQEDVPNGFESLRLAVKYHLQDLESILEHDMLAYLRMQDTFEGFFNSGYKEYTLEKSNGDSLKD